VGVGVAYPYPLPVVAACCQRGMGRCARGRANAVLHQGNGNHMGVMLNVFVITLLRCISRVHLLRGRGHVDGLAILKGWLAGAGDRL